jgi:hypothetical protein
MKGNQEDLKTPAPAFQWSHFGLGCAVGAVVTVLCLIAIAVMVGGLTLFRADLINRDWITPGFNESELEMQPGEGLDASSEIWVHEDGCTVERSELVGTTPVRNLQWTILDEAGTQVLGRSAEGETQYRYFLAGEYRVYLEAWYDGAYYKISNEVVILCP